MLFNKVFFYKTYTSFPSPTWEGGKMILNFKNIITKFSLTLSTQPKPRRNSMKNQDIEVLKHFLEYPIWTSKPIFDKFKTIQNAIFREYNAKGKERFLFVNGTKSRYCKHS